MDVNNFWKDVFSWSDYVKGSTYSASDLTSEVLIVRLRKDNPNIDDSVSYKDKTASWVGSAIHSQIERIMKTYDSVETEVRMSHKNLSGTCDLVFNKKTLADVKTGSEANIKTGIKDSTKWIIQLSIYRILYFKQYEIMLDDEAVILWYCTDTKKFGEHPIELLSIDETNKLIRDFMVKVNQPLESLDRCKLCIPFMHKFCSVKFACHFWKIDDDFSNISEW